MNITDIIQQRRSVRRFKKEIPDDASIEKMLEAARWAPSGLNNQPWRFIVIRDEAEKKGVSQFAKQSHIITNAPLIVLVFLSLKGSYNRDKDLMGIGAAIQNMLLEAHNSGLGTCWLGEILSRKKEVSDYLNLDDTLELMAVVAVGYPDESPKGKRKPLRDLMVRR